ncbi:hypothetical protein NRB_50220 [Novosphingobium sp. 11B]
MAAYSQIDIDLKERESAKIGVLSSEVDTGNLILRPLAVDRLVVVSSTKNSLAGHVLVQFAANLRSIKRSPREHFLANLRMMPAYDAT